MPRADQLTNNYIKGLVFGVPKGSGKSTILASFGLLGPLWIFNYDGGRITIPPGVNRSQVYVRNYPGVDTGLWNEGSARWDRPKNVGELIIKDLKALAQGFLGGRPVHLEGENEPWPLPVTIGLDGFVALENHLIDWLLASNFKKDPEDYGPDVFRFWGARLNKTEALVNGVIPFPCHVIICTWSAPEMKEGTDDKGRKAQVPTGRLQPDLGGKMSIRGPGKVDTCLYAFSEQQNDGVHYYVRTKPDTKVGCVGVRDAYTLPDVIDVTIGLKVYNKPDYSLPYQRIWGGLNKGGANGGGPP